MVIKQSKISKIYDNTLTIENNSDIVGLVFNSLHCGKFKILGFTKTKRGDKLYSIQFIETNTIYHKYPLSQIKSGTIKDYTYPTICGIGSLGINYKSIHDSDPELCLRLRHRYENMISRCYNPNDKSYVRYGAKGIRVDNRWHIFENFYNDIINMPNFNRDLIISGELQLDKDIKQQDIPLGMRVYSKETISLVSFIENVNYRNMSNVSHDNEIYFVEVRPNGDEYLRRSVAKFSEKYGFSKKMVSAVICGRKKSTKNHKFRRLTDTEIEQVKSGIIEENEQINVNNKVLTSND